MKNRAVIHVDLDAFFASVELKRRPELRGRPVVVGGSGDPTKRGVVSAASYEARAFGIRSGMPLKRALKLCPQAVFLPVDFEAYERESERFMEILGRFTPLVESFGLDEAFVEITEGKDPFEESVKAAAEIKRLVKEELRLTASAGVGPNKLIAKMASDFKKPDGFYVVRKEEVADFLRDLQVRKLPGVGPKTEARLKALGIRTVGELSKAPLQHLERNFGTVFGSTLHEHSRGIDTSPVVPFFEPQSMSREVTFEEDTGDTSLLREILYELTEDVLGRLKDEGYRTKTVAIKVRFSDFMTITRQKTLEESTDSLNDAWRAVLKLFEETELVKKVRLVGVRLSKLEKAAAF